MSDEDFDAAVLGQVREAIDGDPGVLTEYILIAACTFYDDDGEARTSIGWIPGPDSVPHHRLLGLLDAAGTLIRDQMTKED